MNRHRIAHPSESNIISAPAHAPEETTPIRAFMVGVTTPDTRTPDHDPAFTELRRLCDSLGWQVVGLLTQHHPSHHPATVLGSGKVEELKTHLADVDAVVFDEDITPGQQATLEQVLDRPVLTRSDVILRIFERHARTPVARLEVELARLEHDTPRLRERKELNDRGGGGGRGGKGHTGVQLSKQRARQRMAEVREELARLSAQEDRRRRSRATESLVAVLGYTNAGKSSLMRALTQAEVHVQDRLFATLGTTVRVLKPDRPPHIMVVDTVGFVNRLPPALVASFRSTLDEASMASVLLHVVDASDPHMESQMAVTTDALRDVASDRAVTVLVLNKVDRLDAAARAQLAMRYPDAQQVCALEAESVAALAAHVRVMVERNHEERWVQVPYARSSLLAQLHEQAQVLKTEHTDEGSRVLVRASPALLDRLTTA